MNLAIIGATGNVGRKTIEILEKSKIKIENLYLIASKKSAGKKIIFKKKAIKIVALNDYDFAIRVIIVIKTTEIRTGFLSIKMMM